MDLLEEIINEAAEPGSAMSVPRVIFKDTESLKESSHAAVLKSFKTTVEFQVRTVMTCLQ